MSEPAGSGPARGRSGGGRRALLVLASEFRGHLKEALAIAQSANYDVAKVMIRSKPGRRLSDYACKKIAEEAAKVGAETIIYYGYLEPSSIYKLEKESRLRVIDRVMVILEIFALHAGSREAKLQIEMAELLHMLPILREYVRRAKMGEQVDFLGPGQYAYESYVKHVTSRIAKIRRELEELRKRVVVQNVARKERGFAIVAIAGYASAGKTSLFNALTNESKPVGPEYFTTLSAKHKAVEIGGQKIMFVDTVGFVRDVPPEIVESFYSTLQEIASADAVIFVIDSSEAVDEVREKVKAGLETLGKLNALGKPIVFALNKVDIVDGDHLSAVASVVKEVAGPALREVRYVPISALKRINLDLLLQEVLGVARESRLASVAVQEGLRAENRP